MPTEAHHFLILVFTLFLASDPCDTHHTNSKAELRVQSRARLIFLLALRDNAC